MTLQIPYETEGFPHPMTNGWDELPVTWDDVLWAAVTVGRPNRNYVFRHGDASRYEAMFRWSLVRMALEQSGPRGRRLRRTDAARTLDPTEKGAVNYFLGMTFCKLFAAKRLRTPWLLHLDVFRPQLDPVLTGRSRPDLVGKETGGNVWHAFECKGRVSPPDATAKAKAKAQAQRLVTVQRTPCSLHVGAITYFYRDALQFYWQDPPAESGEGIKAPYRGDVWRHYYSPAVQVLTRTADAGVFQSGGRVPVAGLDLEIGIHPAVAKPIMEQRWETAQLAAAEAITELNRDGYQPDGIVLRAGKSWMQPFEE